MVYGGLRLLTMVEPELVVVEPELVVVEPELVVVEEGDGLAAKRRKK